MTQSAPLPADNELLVAYLDGELDENTRFGFEQRLARDETLQSQLVSLQRSWDALDELPVEQPSAEFAASTISLVAATARATEPRRRRNWLRGHTGLLRAVGWFTLAMAAGFAAFALPRYLTARQRLADLPLIQNSDLYRAAGSLEFVRALPVKIASPDVASPASGSDPASAPDHPVDTPGLALGLASSPEQIRRALSDLTSDDLDALQIRAERFQRLSREKQGVVRDLHQQLLGQPDCRKLLRKLQEYYDWLSTLSAQDRDELVELTATDRLVRMERLMATQTAWRREAFWQQVTGADHAQFRAWMHHYLEDHRDEIVALLPPELQRRARNAQDNRPGRPNRPMLVMLLLQQTSLVTRFPEPTEEELGQLLMALSTPLKRELSRLIEDRGPQVVFRIWQELVRRDQRLRMKSPRRGPPGPFPPRPGREGPGEPRPDNAPPFPPPWGGPPRGFQGRPEQGPPPPPDEGPVL
ncbi:MAG TPA: hypothetical protein VIY86_04955 [Pirellulaceae bacterium]